MAFTATTAAPANIETVACDSDVDTTTGDTIPCNFDGDAAVNIENHGTHLTATWTCPTCSTVHIETRTAEDFD